MNDLILPIISGLSIGFLGSFHCIGMCGPIALALPVSKLSGLEKYIGISLYNLGRAFTYAILGLLFGLLGSQFRIWGLQQIISIAAGLLMFLFILTNFSFTSRVGWISKLNQFVQHGIGRKLVNARKPSSLWSIGLLNGLLPCGLVYVAIAAALATMNTLHAGLLMFTFGLGTIPVMAGLMLFGHLISSGARRKLNRAVPYVVGVMAIMLILRGMNLGIPLLSPKMDVDSKEVKCCHPGE